jgi:hypothetical protein
VGGRASGVFAGKVRRATLVRCNTLFFIYSCSKICISFVLFVLIVVRVTESLHIYLC